MYEVQSDNNTIQYSVSPFKNTGSVNSKVVGANNAFCCVSGEKSAGTCTEFGFTNTVEPGTMWSELGAPFTTGLICNCTGIAVSLVLK